MDLKLLFGFFVDFWGYDFNVFKFYICYDSIIYVKVWNLYNVRIYKNIFKKNFILYCFYFFFDILLFGNGIYMYIVIIYMNKFKSFLLKDILY